MGQPPYIPLTTSPAETGHDDTPAQDSLGVKAERVYRGVRSGGVPRVNPVAKVKAHLRTEQRSLGIDMLVICAALFIFGALMAGPLVGNLSAMQNEADLRYLMDKNTRN